MNVIQNDVAQAFTHIYDNQVWGKGSGVGSSPQVNIDYMSYLSKFMRDNEIKSILDYGCGDWQFSRYISWEGCRYFGVDVVKSVIEGNSRQFGSDTVSFDVVDDLEALPEVDLCISKDVFQHLPVGVIKDSLAVLKRKAKMLLITNDVFPDDWTNVEISPGAGRAIRLYREPFNEPAAVVFSYSVIAFGNAWEKQVVLIPGERR